MLSVLLSVLVLFHTFKIGFVVAYHSDRLSYDMVLRKLMLVGDFLNLIFDRPETLHELVTAAVLSKILKELKPHLKNMLY